jgi:hypothetical protein
MAPPLSGKRRAAGLVGAMRAALLAIVPALAWGPHTEITQAALEALGTNDALALRLGPHAQDLAGSYCWMGDYHRVVCEGGNELFFADDYLLFPGATPQ